MVRSSRARALQRGGAHPSRVELLRGQVVRGPGAHDDDGRSMSDERDPSGGFVVLDEDIRVGTGGVSGIGLGSMSPDERRRVERLRHANGPARTRPPRALSVAYALLLGGAASALLIAPVGAGGTTQLGAWLYVGAVIAAATRASEWLLVRLFDRWMPPSAYLLIGIIASAIGVLLGWWAATYTMGGPV